MGFSSLVRRRDKPRDLVTTAILTEQCPHCAAEPADPCDPGFKPYAASRRLSPEGWGGELIMAHISRILKAIKARNINPSMIIKKYGDQ